MWPTFFCTILWNNLLLSLCVPFHEFCSCTSVSTVLHPHYCSDFLFSSPSAVSPNSTSQNTTSIFPCTIWMAFLNYYFHYIILLKKIREYKVLTLSLIFNVFHLVLCFHSIFPLFLMYAYASTCQNFLSLLFFLLKSSPKNIVSLQVSLSLPGLTQCVLTSVQLNVISPMYFARA